MANDGKYIALELTSVHVSYSCCCQIVVRQCLYVDFAVDLAGSFAVLEALLSAVKADDSPLRFGKMLSALLHITDELQ